MLLELMSNGSLAELPPDNIPESISNALNDESSVMLLLPHNKYLFGELDTGSDKWLVGTLGENTSQPQDVYLYDNEGFSLLNDGALPTILPAQTVNALRRKLFMHSAPPGRHTATVLMLRTIMRDHPVFSAENAGFLDEKIFADFMQNDSVLEKMYWALRFALARGELEAVKRLKLWLKAGPEVFAHSGHVSRLWLSIQDIPDKDAIEELEELSFSVPELKRLSAQNISPMVMYNPLSGWIVLGRFGRGREIMFSCWAYANHDLWHELRDNRQLTVQDIIHAIWGEYDTVQAMNERAKYK
ncbi:MAG: hypothetical protein IJU26_06740 [Synergistaceae bacterium]|nr:hypothetical protein [Synergistaceae bacterium]